MQKSDLNILIVEDDTTQREALAQLITKAGYRAVAVKKADEAESIARIKPVHAAVIDCMLPGKNGVDLTIKLRENMQENAPVILISGIYKDRSFQQEAIKKTSAVGFLAKPLDIDKVKQMIDESLEHLMDAPKLDLHALLAAPMASHRERRKALDHVEEMKGYDLPFVFAILLESESSGYLNIVDEDENIYGVTFAKGNILKFDSESTVLVTRQTLIKHGFITEEEVSSVNEKRPLELMNTLVSRGLLSPHVPSLVHCEQIFSEITKLIGPRTLKINFVIDRKIKPTDDSVSFQEFKHRLFQYVDKFIPSAYLKEFYRTWSGHPIKLGPNFQADVSIFDHPMFAKLKTLQKVLAKESALEELLANPDFNEDDLLKALHILAIRRLIIFSETKRVFNLDEHVSRLKSLHADLQGKDPFEIFSYLGVEMGHKSQAVSKTYKDFAKSNHPDTLPQAISEEVKKLNHEVFSWVTEAHNILTDDKKKTEYMNEAKHKDAEKQLRSEDLLQEGLVLIQKGRFTVAKEKVDAAIELYKSDRAFLYSLWVKIKIEADKVNLERANLWLADMKKLPVHTRRTALYYFVTGLLKKQTGNYTDAKNEFEKALQADAEFMDARREMLALKSGTPQKMTMDDLLKADLGTVIGRLFKKKGA